MPGAVLDTSMTMESENKDSLHVSGERQVNEITTQGNEVLHLQPGSARARLGVIKESYWRHWHPSFF